MEQEIEIDDAENFVARIREEYIASTSCSVVLCGAETPLCKFVDWEIKAALDKKHALVALQLPETANFIMPDRLIDNCKSGYTVWVNWSMMMCHRMLLPKLIEEAQVKDKGLIRNQRVLHSARPPVSSAGRVLRAIKQLWLPRSSVSKPLGKK